MVSKNISFIEATKSITAERNGIDNVPSEQIIKNMKLTAEYLFQPLRNWWDKPIGVSSFFRSKELNKLIGGSKTSQHPLGYAIDIDADIFNNGLTNKMIYDFFINRNILFDQLIWEYGTDENPAWVHISLIPNGNNRQMILRTQTD